MSHNHYQFNPAFATLADDIVRRFQGENPAFAQSNSMESLKRIILTEAVKFGRESAAREATRARLQKTASDRTQPWDG